MNAIASYEQLEELGRVRLSRNFFMRDFLHSEIAQWHGLRNVPDDPDRAIEVGRMLCEQLLEPLQETFGRIHVRSGYRSPQVNELGNRNRLNCASNESNFAAHIWDYPDAQGRRGATACVVVPWLVDRIAQGGQWTEMAWWIHDHLPYSTLCFFPRLAAFNINWHETPERRIDSYCAPKGCLTKPGLANHGGRHQDDYRGFPALAGQARSAFLPSAPQSTIAKSAQKPLAAAPLVAPPPKPEVKAPTPSVPRTVVIDSAPGRKVMYRAVHTKTRWRKVNSHQSVEAAIRGKDGAAALFRRKARVNYQTFGDPLYVLVWAQGESQGYAIRPKPGAAGEIEVVGVDASVLIRFDQMESASDRELDALFGQR